MTLNPQGDIIILSVDSTGAFRWVYYLNGPADWWDQGNDIMYASDGNVYVAGFLMVGDPHTQDFTVVSVDTAGSERWVYQKGSNLSEEAHCITEGSDGNIYAAGDYHMDLYLASLDTGGALNWDYIYSNAVPWISQANDIVQGADGNLYMAGYIAKEESSASYAYDFAVLNVDSSGTEQWVYSLEGTDEEGEVARAVVYGSNGSIYGAGYIPIFM
jgi:hypothetical protein